MPEKPEHWAWFATWLEEHWPAVYAALLGTVIAGLRVLYGGGGLRQVGLEAPLCGAITLSASAGLQLIAIPASAAPFFGGVIGLLGVEGVRAIARRHLHQNGGPQ
ncbi:phage holin, lambda family [Metapseudomonas furukawaii]|jgi:lambda family phage holin|uniref:Phage holin Lambda-like group I holin n=1 Tax=Metapseudomonas furukawaii TaxID=1149133 RepID=A0AAD1FF22_METFU|nr:MULTISPECIES: phage holin, lambda family [Pseudomonas]ELS26647.1 phage holin, lambda family [Pseudomonas furukawaii]OWJ92739.1 phage holin, lambda family [Pseudomonas sp. A46]BAU74395.1 phage holin Lambda-like group I holin [Pseudomonas furukawaii]